MRGDSRCCATGSRRSRRKPRRCARARPADGAHRPGRPVHRAKAKKAAGQASSAASKTRRGLSMALPTPRSAGINYCRASSTRSRRCSWRSCSCSAFSSPAVPARREISARTRSEPAEQPDQPNSPSFLALEKSGKQDWRFGSPTCRRRFHSRKASGPRCRPCSTGGPAVPKSPTKRSAGLVRARKRSVQSAPGP